MLTQLPVSSFFKSIPLIPVITYIAFCVQSRKVPSVLVQPRSFLKADSALISLEYSKKKSSWAKDHHIEYRTIRKDPMYRDPNCIDEPQPPYSTFSSASIMTANASRRNVGFSMPSPFHLSCIHHQYGASHANPVYQRIGMISPKSHLRCR